MPSVLVTGAGRGFGRELGRVFLERGWTVFPLVRAPEAMAALGRGRPVLPALRRRRRRGRGGRHRPRARGPHLRPRPPRQQRWSDPQAPVAVGDRRRGHGGALPRALCGGLPLHAGGPAFPQEGGEADRRQRHVALRVDRSRPWAASSGGSTPTRSPSARRTCSPSASTRSFGRKASVSSPFTRGGSGPPPPPSTPTRSRRWRRRGSPNGWSRVDRNAECGLHDLMAGGVIPW